MRTSFLLVAAASLMLVAPAAMAQDVGINNPNTPTPTTLYFHVINVQDMPINTQLPSPDYSDEGRFGQGTNTITCVDAATGGAAGGTTSQNYHTFYGYSSPSYVEYDYMENGQPRTHPERGISYDAVFDPATPFTLYWYVSVFNSVEQANPVPTPLANIVVQSFMRAGDAISVDDKAYDSGPVIAEGRTDPAIMTANGAYPASSPGSPHPQVTYTGTVDDKHIYQFAVPMELKSDKVPRATGFNVRIDILMENPACSDAANKNYVMPNQVAIHSDPANRPRMEFAVTNPIRLEYLHPQFVGDDLVVHTSMNSAWGNYDVDETTADGIKVSIEGPSPATSLAKAALVQRFHEHYHHQEAVDVTYVWPYKADRASNGLYTVFVEFQNDQANAKASGTAQFEIGKGTVIGCGGVQEASQRLNDDCAQTIQKDGKAQSEESPGAPLLGVLGLLGAAAFVLRRRKA